MGAVRLILVGGFLGAGKTTVLNRLARHFTDKGLRVGVITNDQGNNLVDTQLVKVEGFNVEEVTGGCFCCRLNDFTDAGEKLLKKFCPDVILAEPVGSCTDLVATVIQPLKLYADQDYSLDPFTVFLDPARANDIVISGGAGGFSEKVAYIFKKQLEEADIIALNKVDTLTPSERKELSAKLKEKLPQAKIMEVSALTGEGFPGWVAALEQKGSWGRNIAEVDYAVYAEGEAELAWLNFTAELSSPAEFDADIFLSALAENIRQDFLAKSMEAAHVKFVMMTAQGNSSINLVGNSRQAKTGVKCSGEINKPCRLIANARVHGEPQYLESIVVGGLKKICQARGITAEIKNIQSFRPSPPKPVYRFDKAVR